MFEILVCVLLNALAAILLIVVPTPEMVTFELVLCIPWLGWVTLTTAEPLVVLNGFAASVLLATASLTNVTEPVLVVVNLALLILNFKSCSWLADHVLLFCDLNKTPSEGCLETNRPLDNAFSPVVATYAV